MKAAAGLVMIANAALFFFGAVQHAGYVIGPFHEPQIIPAAIVESICGVSLLWGAIAILRDWKKQRGAALIANFIALSGVILGMVALALGRGPRTASNDLYHRIMLVLIGAAVLLLLLAKRRVSASRGFGDE